MFDAVYSYLSLLFPKRCEEKERIVTKPSTFAKGDQGGTGGDAISLESRSIAIGGKGGHGKEIQPWVYNGDVR